MTASKAPRAPKAATAVPKVIHTTGERDSLYALSCTHYGTGHEWPAIVNANAKAIGDRSQHEILPAGLKLTIPPKVA